MIMLNEGMEKMEKPVVGISSCLLGENVRYDGGHKLDRFLRDTLGAFVDYVRVCPEVECGFPIPREAFHLEGDPERPRLVTSRTSVDHTERMEKWANRRVRDLAKEDLCGFIFKSGSPSSGMERVKVKNGKGMPVKKGQGIFARTFIKHFPLLPVEEEGRLHDMELRENFIERIFTLMRWKEMMGSSPTMGKLVDFHTRHKMLILSHNQQIYREMGMLVATGGKRPGKEFYDRLRPTPHGFHEVQVHPQETQQRAHARNGLFQESPFPGREAGDDPGHRQLPPGDASPDRPHHPAEPLRAKVQGCLPARAGVPELPSPGTQA
jgi:uncharacterized protein YbbK (DUF523 family)